MNNIYLCGTMGSGKSTIGKLVAEGLDVRFVDLDAEIEAESQKTVKRIFAEEGEEAFRQWETRVLRRVAASKGAIVSLGGGTLLREENRCLLKKEMVIALVCSADVAYNRCLSDQKRPLLLDFEDFQKRCAEREAMQRKVSDLQIRTDKDPAHKVAKKLITKIKEENCV